MKNRRNRSGILLCLTVAAASINAAMCARRSLTPELAQDFSDWFQDPTWHEQYRVQRGRGAMWRQWTTDLDPLAVCNDGSPGAFYVRRGQGQGINRWLIRFQGAQYCWDAASCELRRSNNHSQFLMTSRHAPEWISNMLPESPFVYPWMMKAFGVLNVDPIMNPLWHNWNHVYLFPCSSDAFLGDAAATEALPWHFRGRRYAFTAFQMLLKWFQLDEATDVLLVGDSTGGAGMTQVMDDLHGLVAAQAPGLQRFKAWVDGGWMYPAEQPGGGEFFFSPQHLSLLQQNAHATFHGKCSEHYPEEPWRCFYAANVWPHAETPILYHHCLYDFHVRAYLLGENTTESMNMAQWEKIRASYIASFRLHEQQTAAMSRTERMVLQTSQPKARLPSLFSPACTFHQMSDADFLTASSQVGQLLFLEVMKDWFLGLEEEVFVVDTHPGVRNQNPPPHAEMWRVRTSQYFDFIGQRRSLGLPGDIYETEPEFLMQPLELQPAETAISDLSNHQLEPEVLVQPLVDQPAETAVPDPSNQPVESDVLVQPLVQDTAEAANQDPSALPTEHGFLMEPLVHQPAETAMLELSAHQTQPESLMQPLVDQPAATAIPEPSSEQVPDLISIPLEVEAHA